MARVLFIFGGSSTALEIQDTARLLAFGRFDEIKLVVPASEQPDGASRINIDNLGEFVRESPEAKFILSMWDQRVRANCLREAERYGLRPTTIIHPNAYVAPSASLDDGTYIAAFAAISTHAIVGPHVVVNYHVSVGHDSQIGAHSFLNPGARISGNVSIGNRVLIGSNAFVLQGKSIGDDTVVDALTYVGVDIGEKRLCTSRQMRDLKRPFC